MTGFTQVPNVLLTDRRLTPAAKLVYEILLSFDHGGRKGKAWPSQARIAEYASLSVRQVRRILECLENAGLLSIITESGKVNTYVLHLRCNGEGIVDNRTCDTDVTGMGNPGHQCP